MVEFAFECFTNREFELSSPDVEQVIEVNPVDGQVHLRTSFAYLSSAKIVVLSQWVTL